ncbi:MAG: bifunctional [glutamate--ammonia ligase]-adenylyl-L-tyrosine phosphorylase/[glutamate--ammonia-ligase] adenylyltransferase [Gemmataceae bacterium]
MQVDQLRHCIESPSSARPVLAAWGLRDLDRGQSNLGALTIHLGYAPLAQLAAPLARLLPRCADPDMALNNLERFFAHPDAPSLVPQLLDNRARPLEILFGLFSTSQLFSDLLARHPDYLDMLRVPLRKSPCLAELRDGLQAEADAALGGPSAAAVPDDAALLRAFRRFRHRQLLRIGTNDIIRDRPLEEITRDISRVADASLDVALAVARRLVSRRFGEPMTADGQPVRAVVLAFGKLGGEELNYSSDIDLMFVYSDEGQTVGKRITSVSADEYFARVVSELVRLLAAHTDHGQAYRIDLRLRPEGQRGPLARSLASTLAYYDGLGRTWERQALIKVRPVAGDLELGRKFLQSIEPFVYRKYLTFAEINEIKVMKRRIEQKTSQAGDSGREVKTGHGGIRDIEFTIQFLQLLNGGDLPEVRQRNTLAALAALEKAGCLTDQEYRVLDDSYRFLRRTEHRLQLLFDLQTHRLPARPDELRKLALRMGYQPRDVDDADEMIGPARAGRPQAARPDDATARAAATAATPPPGDPLEAFLRDYRDKTEPTRHILDHLLHQTFAGQADTAEPESDLLLAPNPDPETIRSVLGRYPFRDVDAAYANLVQLGQEAPFLSPRRCRHFLASIAPSLLRAIAETPDPDMALLNLEKVTGSLGAKTVLWELFSFNPPSLKLYVELCASSQFLSEILINNPGMIDELLDSLVLNQPRTRDELATELTELCRGAGDLDPILHSFQDQELLRIGVRDILGKDTIQETTAALSDLAETILCRLAEPLSAPLLARYGTPIADATGEPCRFAVVALGKLGAHEMNYHSDVDLMMVYEGDGRTCPPPGSNRHHRYEATDNFHFFTELGQRLIKGLSHHGPRGRLYQVDMRLRPTGKSGSLVVPLCEFRRYFTSADAHAAHPEGAAQLWERQALARGRVLFATGGFADPVRRAMEEAVYDQPWNPACADEIAAMRERLEASRSARDLKRGPGGLADVEFLVQLLQLAYGRHHPALRTPNTWQALAALEAAGLLAPADHAALRAGYDFLLRVQSRLRIVHNRTLDAVPEAGAEVEKLARRLGFESGTRFRDELKEHRRRVRQCYRDVVARERQR